MANVTFNIDIPEEEFKTAIVERLNGMEDDALREILLKSVEVALIADKDTPKYDPSSCILVQPTTRRYNQQYEPTPLMKEIVKAINCEQYLKDIAKEVAQYIRDNYKSIVREYIVDAFTRMLFSESKEYELKSFIVSCVNGGMK